MIRTRAVLNLVLVITTVISTSRISKADTSSATLQKRWLFVWRNMSDPKEVDRMIERFPVAADAGYNSVVFSPNIPPGKAPELINAAKQHHLDLIAIVMGNPKDRNYVEGVLVKDALFIVHGDQATHLPDNPTRPFNTDFENVTGNHFNGWSLQDDEEIATFADHMVAHGGRTSLRMQDIGKNDAHHCRLSQPLKLQPHRQYLITVWVKTENLTPADAEVKVLTSDASR